MRKTLFLALAVVVLGGVISGFLQRNQPNTPSKQPQSVAIPATAAIADAKQALEAEKRVEGVFYDPEKSAQWQIGMVNDGSSRVGYAEYVCGVLKEKGAVAPGTNVKIIDVANLLVPAEDRNMRGMGTVDCNDYRVIDAGDMTPVIGG